MKTIAIIPGSYNPIHIGHINILEKAEAIFGKGNVFLCFGINPDKVSSDGIEDYIKKIEQRCKDIEVKIQREVRFYKGFLHDYISSLESEGYNVVVVRGLRNGDDLDYEVNQLRFINDFKKGVKTTFIVCDKEYEHISSSAIRKLEEFGGKESIKNYII